MNSNFTVLKTFTCRVFGLTFVVEQLYFSNQVIMYKSKFQPNSVPISSDAFWDLEPTDIVNL